MNIFSHNNVDHKHHLSQHKLIMAIPTPPHPTPSIRLPQYNNTAHIAVDDNDTTHSSTATVATSLVRRVYAWSGSDDVNNRHRNRALDSFSPLIIYTRIALYL